MVNNLRGDQPEKLGLDYKSLGAINPAIVCLHISAYGRDNERKAWPGYDFLMQAEAGLMRLTGEPDGPPHALRLLDDRLHDRHDRHRRPARAACCARSKTGKGCDVDTCLFDVAMHQLSYPGTWYLNGGDKPSRLPRSAHQSMAPVQTVPDQGWLDLRHVHDGEVLGGAGREDRPRRADRAIRASPTPARGARIAPR